jgi:hypothetical protein
MKYERFMPCWTLYMALSATTAVVGLVGGLINHDLFKLFPFGVLLCLIGGWIWLIWAAHGNG